MTDLTKHIEAVAKKASETDEPSDAMRFSQAACNLANTMAVLKELALKSPVSVS